MSSIVEMMKENLKIAGIAVAALAILCLVLIARLLVDIPPGSAGVVVKKMGWTLPAGEVVAPDDSYAGIQQQVLPTGWHLVNPFTTEVKVVPAVEVPKGRAGIVNRKAGKKPKNADDILVDAGERGYQRDVLSPGTYFVNPHIEEVEIVDAVEIKALHVGIVTSRTGTPSSKDIVDKGERGVWKEVLRPGTYYMNTKGFQVEIVPAIEIKPGSLGVVTSRTGTSSKNDLVGEGERGVWRDVLRPGTYFLNTKAYTVEVASAVKIDPGFVGVVVLRTGAEPKSPNAVVVEKGERGVQPYVLHSGLHYLNPYEYNVVIVDSRIHKYEMSKHDAAQVKEAGEIAGDDRLEFPSADGFEIKVDTAIEWLVNTDRIPFVVATIGTPEEIVRKILRPNAREIGRLEGSKLKAEDFIKGEAREKFVTNFSHMLKERCAEKGIIINKALVREVEGPKEVAQPLKDREVAILQRMTNEEKQRQAQSEALLAEQQAKIEQKKQLIRSETEKKMAEMNAEREKAVAKIQAEKMREVADVEKAQQALILDKQKLEAQGIRELADAEAHRARSLILADGALDKKLKAWADVMKEWAQNGNLVPRIVVGGGGEGGKALTGQELILSLMAIERLDRFASAPIGDLEKTPEKPVTPVGGRK